LLDALRDQFGSGEFNAKEVLVAAKASMIQSPLELALLDLAGDRALVSVKSLGRVLKFREGRMVHGLRLTGRQDKNSGARVYRIKAEEYGFDGYNGFPNSHTEKGAPPPIYEQRETNPLNPSNPSDGVFDPESWA